MSTLFVWNDLGRESVAARSARAYCLPSNEPKKTLMSRRAEMQEVVYVCTNTMSKVF